MLSSKPVTCPLDLLKRARALPSVRMAVAAADALLPLESARAAAEAGIAEPVLVGNAETIRRLAADLEWDLAGVEIHDAEGEAAACERAAEIAAEDGMLVKGHTHTDIFVRAILKRKNGLFDDRRLTHCFRMTVANSDTALIITDAAVNVAPDETLKKEIILNAAALANALGNPMPNIALLSGTEEAIDSMPSSIEAATLAGWAESAVPNARVFGPLAFDNAVSAEAAKMKGITHPVAGAADILVVPNIETGNALFKMMVYFMGACAAGVISGARAPVVLTSRADPPEARLASIAIAAIQASIPADS